MNQPDTVPSTISADDQDVEEASDPSSDVNESDTMSVSQSSNFVDEDFAFEGTSIVHTALPPGKVSTFLLKKNLQGFI